MLRVWASVFVFSLKVHWRTMEIPENNPSYGDYILRTGNPVLFKYEEVLGAFFYQRFRNRSRIVEIGPGRCWFTRQNPTAILAIDNSPELVQHYSRQGIDIRLGSVYDTGVPDEVADGLFCCWLFEHLSDPLRAMKEIHRVLKPNGYALVIVPTPHNMNAFYDDYTHVRPFTSASLMQLAADSGFTRHKETHWPFAFGSMHVVKYFNKALTLSYLNFSDRFLRKLGLLNRNQLLLEVWK
jgi:SAM-dependent methyltransferase